MSGGHRPGRVEDAADALLNAAAVACMTHVRSDGDACAALALAEALSRLGKRVQVFHDLPPSYAWLLPDRPSWEIGGPLAPETFVVTLDTASYARVAWPDPYRATVDRLVREAGREEAVPLAAWDGVRPVDLVIDHHATNRGYGRLNWIEPDRSAVSEMVLDLLRLAEARTGTTLVDETTAVWLFVGLATSTDWFTRDTTDRTWEAARLLDARGRLDKAAIAARLQARSPGYFRLSGRLRERAVVAHGVAHVAVTREDLAHFGVSPSEAAAFIDELRALPAAIYLVFVDLGDEGIRVRLRSDVLPVHRLAQAFGGGGHERAAGTVLRDGDAVAALITAAEAAVREAGPGAGIDGNHRDAPKRHVDGGADGARARDSRGGGRSVPGPGQRP